MLDNLKKADERSGKLEDLEDRADQLLAKVSARRLAGWPRLPGEAVLVRDCGWSCSGRRRRTSTLIVCDGGIFREAFPPGWTRLVSVVPPRRTRLTSVRGSAARSRDSPAGPLPLPCVSNSISCCLGRTAPSALTGDHPPSQGPAGPLGSERPQVPVPTTQNS